MAGRNGIWFRLYLKELLLLAYLCFGLGHYLERIESLGFTYKVLAYLVMFSLCLLGLYSASRIRNSPVRIVYGVLLASSALMFDSYVNITAGFLTYNAFLSQIYAAGFVGDAIRQFLEPLLVAFGGSLLLLLGIVIRPRPQAILSSGFSMITPVLVLGALVVLMFARGGDGARGLPSSYIPLAYSVLMQYEAVTGIVAERQAVRIPMTPESDHYDIVLVVDESVVSSYFDVNASSGVQTNLGETHENFKILNFGNAAAITNCSTETNLSLRYGGTRDNYLVALSQMPSIWSYAKSAGLRTVYIDAQKTNSELHNSMTPDEVATIDEFVQFDDVPVVDRDMAAAEKIAALTNNGIREFIYVNKVGAHFPVHDKFPDEFTAYEPILPRGHYAQVSDTGSRDGFAGETNDWVLYRNSYRNTLLWNVGYFFKRLLKEASPTAVVIYTSDHGQELHVRGNPGVGTHCSPEPMMEEGTVPLVILQGTKTATLDFARHLELNRNRASHYNIFPTLLLLMHYQRDEVVAFYGTPLDEQTDDVMTFNTNYHARLGKTPTWKQIDVDALVVPPASDYSQIRSIAAFQPKKDSPN